MKAILLSLLFVGVAAPALAEGDNPISDIRAELDAADIGALEESMASLHRIARDTGDYGTIRQVYGTLFETTHPARFDVLTEWQTGYPDSVYAKSALAWAFAHQAFMYRGESSARQTASDAHAAFYAAEARLDQLALAAYALDPEYLPAGDAVLRSQLTGDKSLVEPTLAEIFQTHPNRHSLKLAQWVVDRRWAGSDSRGDKICENFADQVPTYSAVLCQAELALQRATPPDWDRSVIELLMRKQRFDRPYLNYVRLYWLLLPNEPVNDIIREEADELLRSTLNSNTDFELYTQRAQYIAAKFGDDQHAALEAAWQDLFDASAIYLPDDPYNPKLLMLRMLDAASNYGENYEPAYAEQERALFADALHFGRFDPEIWMQGAWAHMRHVGAHRSFVSYPYWNNAIVLSADPVEPLFMLIDALRADIHGANRLEERNGGTLPETGPDWAADRAWAECKPLEAARNVGLLCRNARPRSAFCDQAEGYIESNADMFAKALANPQCPTTSQGLLSGLSYTEIPVAELTNWTAEHAPGYRPDPSQ